MSLRIYLTSFSNWQHAKKYVILHIFSKPVWLTFSVTQSDLDRMLVTVSVSIYSDCTLWTKGQHQHSSVFFSCSEESKSCKFEMTWGWVYDKSISSFEWTSLLAWVEFILLFSSHFIVELGVMWKGKVIPTVQGIWPIYFNLFTFSCVTAGLMILRNIFVYLVVMFKKCIKPNKWSATLIHLVKCKCQCYFDTQNAVI